MKVGSTSFRVKGEKYQGTSREKKVSRLRGNCLRRTETGQLI